METFMGIDCTLVSDLHGHYPELEGGDLLIVAGDFTATDQSWEYIEFAIWLNKQRYSKKVLVAGNHDNIAQKCDPFISPANKTAYEWDYLCDSGTEFEGLKIWGCPWTKTFEGMNPRCKAFTCDTDEEVSSKFALIPEDTDILITHSPPFGIFDEVKRKNGKNEYVGSIFLRNFILSHHPKLHVFGHIHEHGGKMIDLVGLNVVNASIVNERYEPVNKPVRIIL